LPNNSYSSYDIDDNQWATVYNVTNLSGQPGKGKWPDILVSTINTTPKVHVIYKNPIWKDPDEDFVDDPGQTRTIYGIFNRDFVLSQTPTWESTAQLVEENEVNNLADAGFSAPFTAIYDGGTKLACAYTYADHKELNPPGGYETGYYHLVRKRTSSLSYSSEWENVWASQSNNEPDEFTEDHFLFSGAFSNSLYWVAKEPWDEEDEDLHVNSYNGSWTWNIKTLSPDSYPKMADNQQNLYFVTWKEDGEIYFYRKYRGEISGTITENTLWSGDIYVDGDVTVNSNVTLTIIPDTEVTFDDSDSQSGGKSSTRPEIIVNGTLQADSTTFTATTKGDWYGIVFNSGASSTSYLEDCTLEKAYDAVYIDGSDPTIKDCEIKNADHKGIVIINSGAEPTIEECYVHDCDSYPLYLANTSGSESTILNNKIYGGSTSAVYISYSDGDFAENEFRTTSGTSYGVYVFGSTSDPDFDAKEGDTGNLFDLSNISSHGAYVSSGSPEFGDSGPHDGDNDFLNRGSDKYIYNHTGSTINAESNYWGGTPQASWFSGNVDYTPYDASSNGAGPSWKAAANPYISGKSNYESENYEAALAELKAALSLDSESPEASIAVFKMAKSALNLNKLANEEEFLKELSSSSNSEVRHMSRTWLAYLYAMQGLMEKAEKMAFEAPEKTKAQRAESFYR